VLRDTPSSSCLVDLAVPEAAVVAAHVVAAAEAEVPARAEPPADPFARY